MNRVSKTTITMRESWDGSMVGFESVWQQWVWRWERARYRGKRADRGAEA